jgi:outer membrane lipoprotein LolB
MRRACVMLSCCAALAACVTPRPAFQPLEWTQRLGNLQKAEFWQLDGRAAVAIGEQGWQATMDWRQQGESTEVHLAGPLGIGALVLSRTPAGLSLNGAAPNDAVLAQLQQRLGFDLPLDQLRYWLLGVPDPRSTFDLVRNDQDRARQLIQAGWSVDYDRYMPIGGDLLPEQMVLNHQGVRVRIAVDHWEPPH